MQTEVIIKKKRKYYDVLLGLHSSYGYATRSLFQNHATYQQALDHATNVAQQNNYKLIK